MVWVYTYSKLFWWLSCFLFLSCCPIHLAHTPLSSTNGLPYNHTAADVYDHIRALSHMMQILSLLSFVSVFMHTQRLQATSIKAIARWGVVYCPYTSSIYKGKKALEIKTQSRSKLTPYSLEFCSIFFNKSAIRIRNIVAKRRIPKAH